MEVILHRFNSNDTQTIGVLYIIEDNRVQFACYTLELPWLNNESNKSCIPTGEYQVVKRTSPKFGEHFHIKDVPERSYILIHSGNFHTQIRGCVLVGDGLTDINSDGYVDVINSRKTLKKLLDKLPEQFNLKIKYFI